MIGIFPIFPNKRTSTQTSFPTPSLLFPHLMHYELDSPPRRQRAILCGFLQRGTVHLTLLSPKPGHTVWVKQMWSIYQVLHIDAGTGGWSKTTAVDSTRNCKIVSSLFHLKKEFHGILSSLEYEEQTKKEISHIQLDKPLCEARFIHLDA